MNTTERRPHKGTGAQETGAGRHSKDTTGECYGGQLTLGQEPVVGAVAPEASGVQRAIDRADDWWSSVAMSALRSLAAGGRPFQAFDLTEQFGCPDPDHSSRWGGLFRSASASGLIVHVGFTQSRRPTCAGGLCRVWRGAS